MTTFLVCAVRGFGGVVGAFTGGVAEAELLLKLELELEPEVEVDLVLLLFLRRMLRSSFRSCSL